MRKSHKAFQFRIYPTEEQKELFAKTFGSCRFIYNQMLSDKMEEYKKTGKMLKTTPAAYKKEFSWLKEVDFLPWRMCSSIWNGHTGIFLNVRRLGFRNSSQSIIAGMHILRIW